MGEIKRRCVSRYTGIYTALSIGSAQIPSSGLEEGLIEDFH